MDRRQFLQSGALAAASLNAAERRSYTIENRLLAWHLEADEQGLRSTALENRISGARFELKNVAEAVAVFSAAHRMEIPRWEWSISGDEQKPWSMARNLAGGQRGRQYDGTCHFRHRFGLPPEGKGRDICFTLGGHDEQDWKERRVFVNGIEIGHRRIDARWRTPGVYTVRPGDAAYSSLQFSGGVNTLLVKTTRYDFHFEGLDRKALDRYVYHAYLFDQFITIGQPFTRATGFQVKSVEQESPEHIRFELTLPGDTITAVLDYRLDGFVRRKTMEVRNNGAAPRLLLDFELDHFHVEGRCREGGQGKPVFVNDEAFFALEHPAGVGEGEDGRVKLWHCPGRVVAPGGSVRSETAVVGVAPRGEVLEQFHRYLFARSPRRQKGRVSIFTSYGINNQWGGCGTLADQEVLSVQEVVRRWQAQGVKLDYFTLDTGWPQNDGDLTEFISSCFPDGPAKVLEGVDSLGMKFGLWFSVSWGGWANGSNVLIQPGAIPDTAGPAEPPVDPPVTTYRNGYPVMGGAGRQMCLASEPYFQIFRDAVLHHVEKNKARLIKFDSGNYYCLSTSHAHLPGKYSTEAMFNRLIEIARRGRQIASDLFVTWYWGAGSPFWALHGDIIAESGLFMEGSGTSWVPTLYYRDAVTLSLDQNTQFASLVPPLNKDSLGIWVSQIRWANFMGRERWREALIMDLGRGSMVFPQIWGDPNLLGEEDVRFLARLLELLRANDRVFLRQRKMFGDAWANEPYGYSFFDGAHGFLIANNCHFKPRVLRLPLPAGDVQITTHFPERTKVGSGRDLWMRPFETMLLEVSHAAEELPARSSEVAHEGSALALAPVEMEPWMEARFADAARFEKAGLKPGRQCFGTSIGPMLPGRSMLSVVVTLANEDGSEYRYKPVVVEIVQVRCRVGGRLVQMFPVPDARRFGNTQSAGCSWVLYKAPLNERHAGEPVEFAVHTYLPGGVKARVEAYLTHVWWQENTRPEADGYYGDAPS